MTPHSEQAARSDQPLLVRWLRQAGTKLWQYRLARVALVSFLVSSLLHLLLLLVLSLIILQFQPETARFVTVARVDTEQQPEELVVAPSDELAEDLATKGRPDEKPLAPQVAPPATFQIDVNDLPLSVAAKIPTPTGPPVPLKSEFAGRTGAARQALLASQGGTAASEAAVSRGLEWLARHQDRDGSWSFDHVRPACGTDCLPAGKYADCRLAATAMALLAYLGAGQTHKKGLYKKQVAAGLSYLLTHGEKIRRHGEAPRLDLRGHGPRNSRMYSHGLATIALCEDYAMTKDVDIRRAAQAAVHFIVDAQDPVGGGWRYEPNQTGDLSVTGWQVMALVSAKAAGLRVPDQVLQGVEKFLTHVQTAGGAFYGYNSPGRKPSMTAVGLLCRMYLGWTPDKRPLQEGVAFLSRLGPDKNNMYYNYYAAQVLHHWGGPEWKRWNEVMREHLIATQDKKGHAAGSWYPADPHGRQGGRLYMTCLCVMTLEVYYRHLPLYQRQVIGQAQSTVETR